MKTKIKLFLVCTIAFALMSNSSCDSVEQESMSGAKQVTTMHKVPLNINGKTCEQQNIDDRIAVTTNPTKVLWIHVIALDGTIIRRMPVRCKVTSSGKRLEPKHAAYDAGGTGYIDIAGTSYETDELIQPDGTYGDSDAYIFWFDTYGRYHQLGTAGGLGYLLTDYPIDLKNPMDEITGLYNVHKAAKAWQEEQESMLKKQESK